MFSVLDLAVTSAIRLRRRRGVMLDANRPMLLAFVRLGMTLGENQHGLGKMILSPSGWDVNRSPTFRSARRFCADGGEGICQRDRDELFDFPWRERCGTAIAGRRLRGWTRIT